MLRINIHNGGSSQTIELAGRVMGPWVDELRSQCDRAMAGQYRLRVDLDQVSFVDNAGARLLAQLQTQRVELLNCSRFVTEQLRIAHSIVNRGET